MLEQHARDVLVLLGILAEDGVFDLHHIDLAEINGPMNGPRKIRIPKLPDSMGYHRRRMSRRSQAADKKLGRRAEIPQ